MGTLVCKIELDKQKGITVTVENADGKITQTVTMDGTTMTLKVAGESDTSTVVQKADSIAVTCKTYTLDAETITLTSTKASKWTSQDTLEVTSTKDMTFTSSAKLTQSATQDAKLSSSANVNVEATSNLTMKGMAAAMSATAGEAKVDGLTLKLSGQSQAEMAAAIAKVTAQGQLSLESSGLANLKGSMTTVGGSLVKLG
ncbi:hypothetical protein [Hyalangium rubrum]|uniref:Auto-transporter adhesin head GIN domain-containing protein n=1 Tax=Hyalangium rubrum TaxID=3103134 RepID=A0ABU5HHX9_9BACT|nr:hypothetical protein [Hyalangium sp. s54d21]MDY7233073.1 hypothetical protein [Hyalangium sp. s54d21]